MTDEQGQRPDPIRVGTILRGLTEVAAGRWPERTSSTTCRARPVRLRPGPVPPPLGATAPANEARKSPDGHLGRFLLRIADSPREWPKFVRSFDRSIDGPERDDVRSFVRGRSFVRSFVRGRSFGWQDDHSYACWWRSLGRAGPVDPAQRLRQPTHRRKGRRAPRLVPARSGTIARPAPGGSQLFARPCGWRWRPATGSCGWNGRAPYPRCATRHALARTDGARTTVSDRWRVRR